LALDNLGKNRTKKLGKEKRRSSSKLNFHCKNAKKEIGENSWSQKVPEKGKLTGIPARVQAIDLAGLKRGGEHKNPSMGLEGKSNARGGG